MSNLRDVVRFETRTIVRERQLAARVKRRRDGATTTIERIQRTTYVGPVAILSCGHERSCEGELHRTTKARMQCMECSPCWLPPREVVASAATT